MRLHDILCEKGNAVFTTHPSATLADVVDQLVEHNCGSLVVCDQHDPDPNNTLRPCNTIGIITERDILRNSTQGCRPLAEVRVAEVMSRRLITGTPHDSVEETMGLMTEKRVRHLPILDDGRLVGVISIGDIVKAQHRLFAVENHYLKSYIQS